MLTYYLNMVETPEDKSKVERLYHTYKKLMKFIALKMLRNEEMAEDAVGDALVALIENLNRIGEVDSADTKAFVYIVIRYTALNSYNRSKRHATVNIDDLINYKVDETDAFENIYLNDWFVKINELPTKYRDVLQLKVYYELSVTEIAKLLSISEDLVRKRLERARKMLRGENHV